jgi:hypothetical protein
MITGDGDRDLPPRRRGLRAVAALHRDGFVINARQRITPGCLRLHRAWCDRSTILKPGHTTWTCDEFVKVCANDRAALERWAVEVVGGEVDSRCYCLAG